MLVMVGGNITDFYYQEVKEKNRIEYRMYKNISKDIVVGFSTTGSIQKSLDSEEQVYFSRFYIGNKSQIDKARLEVCKLDTIQFVE